MLTMENKNIAIEKFAELMFAKIKEVSTDWKQPWITGNEIGMPQNLSGREYTGTNALMLLLQQQIKKYNLPVYMTFTQIEENKVRINKGAKANPVLYYQIIVKDKYGKKIDYERYKNFSEMEKQNYTVIPFQKYYNVFNIDDTNYKETYTEKYKALEDKIKPKISDKVDGKSNEILDTMFTKNEWLCPIEFKIQDSAFYRSVEDKIYLPKAEQFVNLEAFYTTSLHEMAHSTGHKSRLNRLELAMFGTEKYAKEELVAEFSAALVGARMGICVLPRQENAQYLKNWLGMFKGDTNVISTLFSSINKASGLIEQTLELSRAKNNTTETYWKKENGNEAPNTNEEFKIHGKKTLVINNDGATITSNGRTYDATGILKDFKKQGINPSDISHQQWEDMLQNKGIKLKNDGNMYSIRKSPTRYYVKCVKVNLMEM